MTEGLENTGSGDNRIQRANLLCSKPELYATLAIGEKPKKQPFLRRGVGINKDIPRELSTEPSSYSSKKDFFHLSSQERAGKRNQNRAEMKTTTK